MGVLFFARRAGLRTRGGVQNVMRIQHDLDVMGMVVKCWFI